MDKITVIDSLMGTGKTSWAIQYMNEHPDDNFIYITPLLSEDERIVNSTTSNFYAPKNFGNGKLENLDNLITSNRNIASTHALFTMLDNKVKKSLKQSEYTLILDESLQVINRVDISPANMRLALEQKILIVDEKHFVHWNSYSDYDGSWCNYLKIMADNDQLIYVDGKFFMWQYDHKIFELFKNIYILTYRFDKSILANYFRIYNIEYETKSIKNINGHYEVVDYFEPDLSQVINLIDIYNGPLCKATFKKNAYSKSWFSNSDNKDIIKQAKNNLYNLYRNTWKTNSNDFMWTTYKDFANKVGANGYTYIDTDKHPNKTNTTFVSCNARGTNNYANKHYLAYMANIYFQPEIEKYFKLMGNDNVDLDEDEYALQYLIQWIWRSAIRNGERIHLFLPSSRMIILLCKWLGIKHLDNSVN